MKILIQGSLKEELQRGGSSSHTHSHPLRRLPLAAPEQGHGEPLPDHGAWERRRSSPDPDTLNFSQLCP